MGWLLGCFWTDGSARGTQYAALAKGEADEEEEDVYGAFVTR